VMHAIKCMSGPIEEIVGRMLLVLIDGVGPLLLICYRRNTRTPQRGYPPSALPHMEECTYLWGVNTSWGINMAESKRPLNQEDNQAPQPTISHLETDLNNSTVVVYAGL
jgi:hypothetical protein